MNLGTINGSKIILDETTPLFADGWDYDFDYFNFQVIGGFFGDNPQYIAGTITGHQSLDSVDGGNGYYYTSEHDVYAVYSGERQ